MSDIAHSSEDLKSAVFRFDKSLTNLEHCLGQAVAKIAELGRSTGYADAKAEVALASINQASINQSSLDDELVSKELETAKAREHELEEAVKHARTALNEAIEDIRTVLGPV